AEPAGGQAGAFRQRPDQPARTHLGDGLSATQSDSRPWRPAGAIRRGHARTGGDDRAPVAERAGARPPARLHRRAAAGFSARRADGRPQYRAAQRGNAPVVQQMRPAAAGAIHPDLPQLEAAKGAGSHPHLGSNPAGEDLGVAAGILRSSAAGGGDSPAGARRRETRRAEAAMKTSSWRSMLPWLLLLAVGLGAAALRFGLIESSAIG